MDSPFKPQIGAPPASPPMGVPESSHPGSVVTVKLCGVDQSGNMAPIALYKGGIATIPAPGSATPLYPRAGNPLLNLNASTKSIVVKMGEVIATTNPDMVWSYDDVTSSTLAEGENDAALNGTVEVTGVAAPATGTRAVKYGTICNVDTIAHTVIVQLAIGATRRTICKVRLNVNDTLLISPLDIKILSSSAASAVAANRRCEGRLTLNTGDPIPQSDQTAKATLYWTQYSGNTVALYGGGVWTEYAYGADLSVSVGAIASGSNYDVFIYYTGSALALELGGAWSSDTARSASLALQDGVYVKAADTTRRYVGTIRGSGAGVCEDSVTKRFVWNYYARISRCMSKVDTTDSWNYSTATWRQANAAAGNQVEYVAGLGEDDVSATVGSTAASTNATSYPQVGVGLDSTTVNSAQIMTGTNGNTIARPIHAFYVGNPGIGYHKLVWIEIDVAAAGVATFYGDMGVTAGTFQSGIVARIKA